MINKEYVKAQVQYLAPTDKKPIYYASQGGADAELSMDGLFEMRQVDVLDGRTGPNGTNGIGAFSLDREGFSLVHHNTTVSDFYNQDLIETVYEPQVEALIIEATGASRVVVFDHTRRSDSSETRGARETREPSAVIHNDYTDNSGPQRVRDLLPAEADDLLSRRFAIINVWRPIRVPAERSPLALCDASSVTDADLIPSERRAKDRIGELMLVTYNADHRWVYFPAMQLDEAVLIKTFDSERDGRARFSIHTAFDDPKTAPDSPPRESIETRVFAFF